MTDNITHLERVKRYFILGIASPLKHSMAMNKLDNRRRSQVVAPLVEGTVLKLLVGLGAVCEEYQDKALRGLSCKRIQCDEIWSFCYAKQKNVPEALRKKAGFGDVWTWTALCPDTKLVPRSRRGFLRRSDRLRDVGQALRPGFGAEGRSPV